MKEYISKWKVVDSLTALENDFQQYKPFRGFEHAMYEKLCKMEIIIGKMPAADVVEVTRCKNCKYYEEYFGVWQCVNLFWNNEFFPETKETDFCSYGKRREE